MAKKINFIERPVAADEPRIGGGALIGGTAAWPATPEGVPLTLIASIPAAFINGNAAFALPANRFVSVFSFYDPDEWLLDYITYHGTAEELETIREGYTKVLLHEKGSEQFEGTTIPARAIELDTDNIDDNALFQSSKIGGEPGLLQAEPLGLGNQRFAMQFYGGHFPKPFNGVFGLTDAVGYLFMSTDLADSSDALDAGTFFVQVT